jgi:15-cis-phytoene synthase
VEPFVSDLRLTTAYAVCRGIARREARNFYYSFVALPPAKRDALSAVYAFMRHADDISDDEKLPAPDRRARLLAWVEDWHQVQSGSPTDDPVFLALADAQKKYRIPAERLDQLVQGTSMDLEGSLEECNREHTSHGATAVASRAIRVHKTFADLYQYCYLVASVVGLVCIRIYGYEDPRAELLAERCGVAFQLTNIIRDVKEDAAMGRVYFPEEDFTKFNLSIDDFQDPARLESARLRPLLELEAHRAREYYEAANELIPLIHDDSRPALWVMVTIYRRLLDKIAANGYDAQRRISLSASEKVRILGRGMLKSILNRL